MLKFLSGLMIVLIFVIVAEFLLAIGFGTPFNVRSVISGFGLAILALLWSIIYSNAKDSSKSKENSRIIP